MAPQGDRIPVAYLPEAPARAMLLEDVPHGGTGSLVVGLLLIVVAVMIAVGFVTTVRRPVSRLRGV